MYATAQIFPVSTHSVMRKCISRDNSICQSSLKMIIQEIIMDKDQIKGRIKEAQGKVKEVIGKILDDKKM